jgi:CTP:molybdopterin cytidylyltransferase MocA
MLRDRARALHADVATIVLAAGGSRRLGHAKQLVELAGEPLVHRVAATCAALAAGPVGVVVGAEADRVAAALGPLRVARIDNPAWADGMASSIRAGVAWARTTSANALLIALADQPLITAKHLAALRDAWLAGAPIAASRFAGVLGAPALFDRARWDDLDKLEGDRGAAPLLRGPEVAAIEWAGGAVDVDTADDVRVLHASV